MKVTRIFNITTIDTDARIREAWGGISEMLTAIGLVKTADTGQVDVTTVLAAVISSINAYHGYEIRTWNDGYGALYMKWEYGVAGASNRPQYRITIGTGSNGSGTITGILLNQLVFGDSATSGATYYQSVHYACRKDTMISIAFTHQLKAAFPTMIFMFDRKRDFATGVPNADGAFALYSNSGWSASCINIAPPYSATVTSKNAWTFAPGVYVATNSGMALESITMDVFPIFGSYPDACIQPVGIMTWTGESSAAVGTVFSAEVYGQTRTYLALASGNGGKNPGYNNAVTGNTSNVIAMIWED
jgi:hypothetical protein